MSTFQLNVTVASLNEVITLGEKQVRVQSDEVQIPLPVTLTELPVNLVPPTIQLIGGDQPQPGGSVKVGQIGEWDGEPVLTYQFVENEVPIEGATDPLAFTFTAIQVGKTVKAREIPDGDLSKAVLSNGILVFPNPPENTTPPVVSPSPTAIFGSTISSTTGEFTNSPDSILIQWQRNEVNIPDKTGLSLDTTGMSLGDVVRTKVTATNAGGTSHEVFSNTTELVSA